MTPETTYTPRAGSLASRVLDALVARGPGAEVSTADLADEVGHPPSTFAAHMGHAQRVGAIVTRNDPSDQRKLLWSLPGTAAAEDEPPAPPPKPRTAFDLAPKLRTPAPPEKPEPECLNLDTPAPLAPAPEETAAPRKTTGEAEVLRELMAISKQPPRPTRFALWDDGALEIRRDGYAPLLLAVEDTKRLLRYLERLVVEEGA